MVPCSGSRTPGTLLRLGRRTGSQPGLVTQPGLGAAAAGARAGAWPRAAVQPLPARTVREARALTVSCTWNGF